MQRVPGMLMVTGTECCIEIGGPDEISPSFYS